MGAGPAGLAAAGHIAKTGARVAVFEGRPRPEDVFGSYPVVLNPRGIQALERLDPAIVQKVNEVGLAVNELHIVPGNRTVAKVPTFGTGIMRDQAAQILLEHAEQQKNITFFWDHKLEKLDVSSRSCTFTAKGGEEVLLANIARLVAADGNRSKVRRTCAEQVEGFSCDEDPWGFSLRFMNTKASLEQTEVDPLTHFVLGDKGYVCQQPNKVWSVSLRVLPGIDEDFLTAEEASEERVQKLRTYMKEVGNFAAENLLDDDSYQGFYSCRAYDGLVIKCSCLNPAGWICIIGDAAHAVQPATGEGINSGLEDASVLGRVVAEHPDDPFAAYDAEQRPNAHALQVLAFQAKDKVVSSPKTRATNLMVTIGLGMAKKLRIIEGTPGDFMLGELAKTVGVKSYAELVEMEARQTRGLRSFANGITTLFRVSDESPLDLQRKGAEVDSADKTIPQVAAGA